MPCILLPSLDAAAGSSLNPCTTLFWNDFLSMCDQKSSMLLAPLIITVDLIKMEYLPLERDIFEHFFILERVSR